MKERTIVVKGTGSASAPVDLVVITTTISALDMNYEYSFYQNGQKTDMFKKALTSIGHDEDSIKTSDFSVRKETEQYKEGKEYKSRFVGYSVSHRIIVEFPFSKSFLTRTIKALSKTDVYSNLNFTFTVKDKTALKKEVLKNAAINAKERALILAEASGVSLGEVLNIDYNWKEVNIYSRSGFDFLMKKSIDMSYDIDINPSDVEVDDVVTIIYSIQ